MIFKDHYRVKGQHSFLSASKYAWIRYDEEKLEEVFLNSLQAAKGTALHALAAEAIRLKVELAGADSLAQFVNDAIGFRMEPEQVLFYSDNCYGTADAISFRKEVLRISDLKTGVTKVSFDQLLVYAAMFCLEYKKKPSEIEIILRIYQADEVVEFIPTYDEIVPIMERIVYFDQRLDQLRAEVM